MIIFYRFLKQLFVVSCLFFIYNISLAGSVQRPFYFMVKSGYGTTTWSMLETDPTSLAGMSAPISAQEGGLTWSVVLGKDIASNFAVEFQYFHLPVANIVFQAGSYYFVDSKHPVEVSSTTNAYAIDGKFIVPIKSHKGLDAFATVGVEVTTRADKLANKANVGAAFGVGIEYLMSDHLSINSAFQLDTGFGKSDIKPADAYIPFLYSFLFGVGYHFSL